MDDAERRRLTELVNDERARRAYAEKELAAQRLETAKWRRRARKAEAAARFSIRLPGKESKAAAPPAPAEGRPRLVFPTIRAGVSGAPDWIRLAVDAVDLDGIDEAALAGLDLVVVGGDRAPANLGEWLLWPTRQPLVAFSPSGGLAQALSGHRPEVVVGEETVPGLTHLVLPEPVTLSEPGGGLEAESVRDRIVGTRGRTVRDVAITLLEAAGIDPPRRHLGVTAIAMTKRPDRVQGLIETLSRMDTTGFHAFLATHGFEASGAERTSGENMLGSRIRFFEMPDEWPLGRCLNALLEQTTTEAWAKIDDDDYYGHLYMEEALLELERTGADMVGKLTHHLYDAKLDRTYLLHTGNEYRFTNYVPGPTFVGRRHTWEEVRFPHRGARVDSIFMRGMAALGMSVYSTSRFEFSYGRGTTDHTWHVDESHYEANGRLVGDGFASGTIFLTPGDQQMGPIT